MEILKHLSSGTELQIDRRQDIFIGGNDPQLLLDSLLETRRQQPRRSNRNGANEEYRVADEFPDGTHDIGVTFSFCFLCFLTPLLFDFYDSAVKNLLAGVNYSRNRHPPSNKGHDVGFKLNGQTPYRLFYCEPAPLPGLPS